MLKFFYSLKHLTHYIGGAFIFIEQYIKEYFKFLDRQGKIVNFIIGIVCALIVGTLDVMAPDDYTFAFFYLLPIAFTTWFAGKRSGLIISVLSAAFWSEDHFQGANLASAWNILSTLGIFCVVTLMLARIRQLWEAELNLSRTDPLTGVLNLRAFSELVEYEIWRLQRQCCSFTLIYLDVDNFKQVNDQLGHNKGDELLKTVVAGIVKSLRKTDVVARMGGDEFTIFLPATNQEEAKVVIDKLNENLLLVSETTHWKTTCSVGVLTCTSGECTLDEVISIADKLMYEVKHTGKNDVRYAEYPEKDTGNCSCS